MTGSTQNSGEQAAKRNSPEVAEPLTPRPDLVSPANQERYRKQVLLGRTNAIDVEIVDSPDRYSSPSKKAKTDGMDDEMMEDRTRNPLGNPIGNSLGEEQPAPQDAQSQPGSPALSCMSQVTGLHVSPTQLLFGDGEETPRVDGPDGPETPPRQPGHPADDGGENKDFENEAMSKVCNKLEVKMEFMLNGLMEKITNQFMAQDGKLRDMKTKIDKNHDKTMKQMNDMKQDNEMKMTEIRSTATSAHEVAKAAMDQVDILKKDILDLKKKKTDAGARDGGGSGAAAPQPRAAAFAVPQPQAATSPFAAAASGARDGGGLPKSIDNDGFTLCAGGFDRNCPRDVMQDFITKEFIGKFDGLTDGKPIYREGSTGHLYFSSREALWRFLKNQPNVKMNDKRIWYTFPKSKEERVLSSTLSTLKKAILELAPADNPIVKWDTGMVYLKGCIVARACPTNHEKAEVSKEQLARCGATFDKVALMKKFTELRGPTASDVKDWE